MSIFISLGSNYKTGSGIYSLKAPKDSSRELRKYLAQRYNSKDVRLAYKGREAIAMILENLDLPPNSLVAINGYTCYAVYQAIIAAGLEPHYLDITKNGLNFDEATLEAAVKDQPLIKAVIVQNTLGTASNIAQIWAACKKHGLVLVEDLAHCAGLKYATGQEAGMVGQAAALSFSQDKVVDAVTGGAAIFHTIKRTQNIKYYPANTWHRFTARLYPWATYIIRKTFGIGLGRAILKVMKLLKMLPGPMSGEAARPHFLPGWQCSVALQSYERIHEVNVHRQSIAQIYRESLPRSAQFDHVPESIYLRFPLRVKAPRALNSFLKQSGIFLADRWYDAPVAPARSLNRTNYQNGQCPNAEKVSAEMVNLPTHVNVSGHQAKFIAGKVAQWLKSK